jgi:O-antigen/teichoic acid export membrane protein
MKNIRNSVYGAIDSLILPILMIFALPVFLNYLDIGGYALWVLVNSVIASLAIFNLGGSEVVIKYISASRGKGDIDKPSTGEIFSTVLLFQSIIVLFIYALFLIVTPIVIRYIESDNILALIDILYIAIPIFFIKQAEELLHAFLKGYEQFGHVAAISSISKILFFLIQILVAIFTESVLSVFFGAFIVSVLLLLSQVLYIKIIHKNAISFSKVNIKTAKLLLNFGTWNGLSSLITILRAHSDKWMVSMLLGLKTFGIYSIGVLIFNQLYNIVSSSVYWIFPEVSKKNSSNEFLVKKYWKLLVYLTIASLGISIILKNLSFLFQLWLGDDVFRNSEYYISTFLVVLPVFTINIISGFYLLGLGLVRGKFFADTVTLLVKIVTIWLVIVVFKIEEWILFFMVFISAEFIAYAIIITRNLPIKFMHLVVFLLLQLLIVYART